MGLPDPTRSRVVLLGTSEYEDAAMLTPLPSVRRTVEDLAAVLTDPSYGIVPPTACDVVVNERNLHTLGRRLRRAAELAEDLLLVYFAGHGLVGGRTHELHLAMYHSDVRDPGFSSLPYERLRVSATGES